MQMLSTYLESFPAAVYSYASPKTKTHLGLFWNPYLGQTRWIEPSNSYHKCEKYAFGYEKEKRKHKILRLVNEVDGSGNQICEFEMYSLNLSRSWKVTDGFAPDWCMPLIQSSSSVKGNTYWYVQEKRPLGRGQTPPNFLVCFDFTTERFGPRLPLPFHSFFFDTVILSSVREEQLAVLYWDFRVPGPVKIWITNKVEPNAVSWNNLFLAVDTIPLSGPSFHSFYGSFFVDEETKIVVFVIKESHNYPSRNVAYIIGSKGYLKKVDLGESRNQGFGYPFVCSYVPSSVQIPNTP
ncbi:PREDICTED: F-box/kelch-repeat protein At3g16740-like [Camelina sativa]|uniref:F-box/kelch-repeat protein At3g16740-like n=1 Tax=Camelina sativa TaxID=90675 RepID=A0ABM0VIA0_CAMSA|nr:PREDICTED: F-box/kelch-repeat protein At3g16740-like [Camelina sativa]